MEKIARIIIQRMAWQRAKGELLSILETFFGAGEESDFQETKKIILEFIEKVESDSPIA